MINTELIDHAVKLAVMSPFIMKERPVSMIILAPPEHGKSEILKQFAFVDTVKISTDFNSFQFADFCTEYASKSKRTIIIPDFLRVVKKKYSTSSNSLTIMNSITEEGWIGKLPLGQIVNQPVVANVITALTQDELVDKRHKWTKMGFISRFVPLSYSYTKDTKKMVMNYIKDRIYRDGKPVELRIPKNEIDISMPRKIADEIEAISVPVASAVDNLLGFRLQRQLQVLAMANALLCGRNLVTRDDVQVIREISYLINFDFNAL